jgi:hypothetical protein
MSRIQQALAQIAFARSYTLRLLDATPQTDWFRIPPAGVSHIAWQVGHLAMGQYRLALERIRGARPSDADFISEAFLTLFGRKSVPDPNAALYPSAAAIRTTFDAVFARVLDEVVRLPEAELDMPVLKEHLIAKTKLDSLLWCAQHELVHAGQIGLLRRQLDHPPLW